jgi:putative ABC transport system substrate-binding protein
LRRSAFDPKRTCRWRSYSSPDEICLGGRLDRRKALSALFAVSGGLLARLAHAQQTKVWRIGVLMVGSATSSKSLIAAYKQGMADLGYVEGRSVRYESRYSDGSLENLNRFARELADANTDLIWAPGTEAALASRNATGSMPIVFATAADPVASGLVRSLVAPGTNATGLSSMVAEAAGKALEILTQGVPKVRRIGMLHVPGESTSAIQISTVKKAAAMLGRDLLVVDVVAPDQFPMAYARLKEWRTDALLIPGTGLSLAHLRGMIDAAKQNRWVTATWIREFAEAGAMFSYGANWPENCRRSAVYVDRILKGAKPADLAVEQPIKFELVINLKAARTIGLEISRDVLARADHLIE